MSKVTISNEFHGTTATVIPAPNGTISARVKRRIDRELCGMPDCQCGKSRLMPADQFGARYIAQGNEA